MQTTAAIPVQDGEASKSCIRIPTFVLSNGIVVAFELTVSSPNLLMLMSSAEPREAVDGAEGDSPVNSPPPNSNLRTMGTFDLTSPWVLVS